MLISYYSFEQLKNKALENNATQNDLSQLGEWFTNYGNQFWNGEYYDINSVCGLQPHYIVDENDECYIDEWRIIYV